MAVPGPVRIGRFVFSTPTSANYVRAFATALFPLPSGDARDREAATASMLGLAMGITLKKPGALRSLIVGSGSLGLAGAVVGAIWLPLLIHYRIDELRVTSQVVDAARQAPSEAVLKELGGFSYGIDPPWASRAEVVACAEGILRGVVHITRFPATAIGIPFDPSDLDRGSQAWQLYFAGLAIPRILLTAYEATGRDEFLRAARDMIGAWGAYEGRAWLPRGFLWNDHAIANRVLVLAQLWRHYRHHPAYEQDVGKGIMTMVAREGQMLAKPSCFTVATNHGVMQNLALWHLCIAFPSLPGVEGYRQLAFDRLTEQMRFYVNDEGVVLEHSAGYHEVGLQVMAMAFRYMALQGIRVPAEWRGKYERAKSFYAALRRPDGSLPAFGDTSAGGSERRLPVAEWSAAGTCEALGRDASWRPATECSLSPVAGYSVWWDGLGQWPDRLKLSQTVTTWSYFRGHGHKHADEMSILLWAGGRDWVTNSGYVDYDADGRDMAEGWDGANAPHLPGEEFESPRQTVLRGSGWSARLAALDLERRGPGGYVARRQLVHVSPNLWIVIDHVRGQPDRTSRTVWASSQDVRLDRGKIPDSFDLAESNATSFMTALISGSPGVQVTCGAGRSGSLTPGTGSSDTANPAPTITVEQPAGDSVAMAVWSLNNGVGPGRRLTGAARLERGRNMEDWTVLLPVDSGGIFVVGRRGDRVFVRARDGRDHSELTLAVVTPDVAERRQELDESLRAVAPKYPRFNDLLSYRTKATAVLLGLLVLCEASLIVYKRWRGRRAMLVRFLTMVCWTMVAAWIIVLRARLV